VVSLVYVLDGAWCVWWGRVTLAMKRPNTAPRPNPIPPEITVLTGQDSMPAWICLPLGLAVRLLNGSEREY